MLNFCKLFPKYGLECLWKIICRIFLLVRKNAPVVQVRLGRKLNYFRGVSENFRKVSFPESRPNVQVYLRLLFNTRSVRG